MSIFKVEYWVSLVFQILYLLVLKIEICPKYFLDKISQKQPFCSGSKTFEVAH